MLRSPPVSTLLRNTLGCLRTSFFRTLITLSLCSTPLALAQLAPPLVPPQTNPPPGTSTLATPPVTSRDAQQLYAAAKQDLLQIRVLTQGSGSQSSVGSGFILNNGPFIITNYHVISRLALEPKSYFGQYKTTDGREGKVSLVAIDVAHDLAVLRADLVGTNFFKLEDIRAIADLQQGEKLFSLGNPLDLGFSIAEGTYNGTSTRGMFSHLIFTGPVNSGMSGGPNITREGHLAGVNVAHRRDGELVSFLVPAEFVSSLMASVTEESQAPVDFRPIIAEQLTAYQNTLTEHLLQSPFNSRKLGQFNTPVRDSEQIRCWGSSNNSAKATASTQVNCRMESRVFVSSDINIGYIDLQHKLVRNKSLHPLQFSKVREKLFSGRVFSTAQNDQITSAKCSEDFVDINGISSRVLVCAEAYHDFPEIYDFTYDSITLSGDDNTLTSALQLYGVSYENGSRIIAAFMKSLTLAPTATEESAP